MLGIHEGRPREMGLRDILLAFIDHRKLVLTRRTQFELREAQARLHILEGLLIALKNLDAVIKLIRASKDAEAARSGLMKQFSLSQLQAQAILDLTLRRLTGLEREKIETEHKEISETIKRLKQILADERELMKLIAGEVEEIKKEFGDARRTQIVEADGDFSVEDLIVEEDVLVTVTHGGYIKRTPLSLYRTQRRGGRGKIGATTSAEDFVERLERVSTHDPLMFFTSAGKVYQLKAYELPECAQTGVQGGGVAAVAQPPLLEAFFHHHAQGFVERIDHRDRGGVMIHALRAPVAANRGDIEVPGAALGLAPPYHLHRAGAEGYRREPRGRTQSLLRATEAGIDSPAVGFQGDTGERGHRVDGQ